MVYRVVIFKEDTVTIIVHLTALDNSSGPGPCMLGPVEVKRVCVQSVLFL